MNRSMLSATTAVIGGVLAIALTGCGGAVPTQARPGPGMMGGDGAAGPGMVGGNGAGPGFTASRPSCSAPAALPGATVTVQLADMGMMSPSSGTAPLGAPMTLRADPVTVGAGRVSLVVRNVGWRTHELVVLPLGAGASVGRLVPGADGKIDEAGSLGEASAGCAAGSGEGIASGAVGWTTVTLEPGRYELVCNLTNHYADGMRQELDVIPA